MATKIRKGDNVIVRRGKDRGKEGHVQKIIGPTKMIVEGINIVSKHVKDTPGGRQSGIIKIESPINSASLALVCPQCTRPAKVGFQILADGSKVRFCKKCKETIG
jgi:large subunit ribosomal protein L24